MPNNLTDYEENRLLDLSVVLGDYVGLLTGLGSDSAAGTEVAGGGYARAAVSFASAASGSKVSNAYHNFMSMPAVTVQGWGIYSAATSGNRKWYGLFKPRTGVASASGNTVTSVAHGLSDGARVVFQNGYAPAGATASTNYFVVGSTTDTFQIATTSGGSAIDLTADGNVVFGDVLTINAGEVLSIPVGSLVLSLS